MLMVLETPIDKFKYLPPINIIITQKIFSYDVFADTLPNPTDVKLLKVKYSAVMYDSPCEIFETGILKRSAKVLIHPDVKKKKKERMNNINIHLKYYFAFRTYSIKEKNEK